MAKDSGGERMPWMKIWVRDLMGDPEVQALSWDQRGRYLWGLMGSWESETPGVATCTEWLRWMGLYLQDAGPFMHLFQIDGDVWVQRRLKREFESAVNLKTVRSGAGSRGNEVKYGRKTLANPSQTSRKRLAKVSPSVSVSVSVPDSETEESKANTPSPDGSGDLDLVYQADPPKREKSKKVKDDFRDLTLPDSIGRDEWISFCEFRAGLKHPWTRKAAELSIGELVQLSDQGYPSKRVIERSIMNGWRGLFQLNEKPVSTAGSLTRVPWEGE